MKKARKYINVILPLPLPKLYTYSTTDEQYSALSPGMRVIVQFGKKKIYTSVVKELHTNTPADYTTKQILSILDDTPVANKFQLDLWDWISEYYMCPVGDVLRAALPTGLKLESETRVFARLGIEPKGLDNAEQIVYDVLISHNLMTIKELERFSEGKNILSILKSLSEKEAVAFEEFIKETYKPKTRTFLVLNINAKDEKLLHNLLDKLNKAPQQQNILLYFISKHISQKKKNKTIEVDKSELVNKTGCSDAAINALIKKGILTTIQNEVSRIPDNFEATNSMVELNSMQQNALRQVKEIFKKKNVVLLHGVTSSGKTELYIQLIYEQLKKSKQVLYLLPEIALTTQIINRLRSVFGNQVGVYHSKFSDSERVEIYNAVKCNETNKKKKYNIILGVRSSVLLPFYNLGLIIVDEEHENTYKQYDPSPRYNARDTAIMLALLHNAKVLLGTATPSIESYFNSETGKYGLVEMNERYLEIEMPEIKIIDVKEAKHKKMMQSHFSHQLISSIDTALKNKEQVILFQNRRGFAPYLECTMCGWVPRCTHCDVSLTYHKNPNKLICHYCGYSVAVPVSCGACGSPSILTCGFGTEKIEDDISIIFPEAHIARMDLDSTRSRSSYEKILNDFENEKINILIGTQMISKGLDFDNVKVVGIVNADSMLNYPDFRSYERSYQLMAQVSGRAGRKKGRGKVLIQTSDPANAIIQFVVENNYRDMYLQQVEERNLFNYPPFYRLIEIILKHRQKDIVDSAANILASALKKELNKYVIGPESPLINKIQDYNLKSILIKINRNSAINIVKSYIQLQINELLSKEKFKSLRLVIDVDPM